MCPSENSKRWVRNTIALIQESFQAPFVNKWQDNVLRILSLAEIFPEALFVRIKRKPEFTAHSILRARRTFLGDERAWFSTKPAEYRSIKYKDHVEQICWQIYYMEKHIDKAMGIIGQNRIRIIHYEEIVEAPASTIVKIVDFYKEDKRRAPLVMRHEIPTGFQTDNIVIHNDPEFNAIQEQLTHLQLKC